MLASANHHDSHFFKPLLNLAQTMGLEVKLLTGDQAYHDKDSSIFKETGARLITPASSKTSLPENVDEKTISVTCNNLQAVKLLKTWWHSQRGETKQASKITK